MAALIWDEQSQAFVETANTPMRYDAESEALVETTGKAFDHDAQAWTEKWSSDRVLYLYNEGDECTNVTGGWGIDGYSYPSYKIHPGTKNAYNMYFQGNDWPYLEMLGTLQAIDLTRYSKMHLDVTATTADAGGLALGICADKSMQYILQKNISNIDDRDYIIDISEFSGEYYISFDIANDLKRKGTVYKVCLE